MVGGFHPALPGCHKACNKRHGPAGRIRSPMFSGFAGGGGWCRGGRRWLCSSLSRSAGPLTHKRALCDIHAPFPPAQKPRLPAASSSDYLSPPAAPDKEKAVKMKTLTAWGAQQLAFNAVRSSAFTARPTSLFKSLSTQYKAKLRTAIHTAQKARPPIKNKAQPFPK